jgi:hypothetical protein
MCKMESCCKGVEGRWWTMRRNGPVKEGVVHTQYAAWQAIGVFSSRAPHAA